MSWRGGREEIGEFKIQYLLHVHRYYFTHLDEELRILFNRLGFSRIPNPNGFSQQHTHLILCTYYLQPYSTYQVVPHDN